MSSTIQSSQFGFVEVRYPNIIIREMDCKLAGKIPGWMNAPAMFDTCQ